MKSLCDYNYTLCPRERGYLRRQLLGVSTVFFFSLSAEHRTLTCMPHHLLSRAFASLPPLCSGLLDAVLDICGVPAAKFRPICSAIDKLDKEAWADVREEMIGEKGLPAEVADRIGTMVKLRGEPLALHARLLADGVFGSHAGAKAALDELALLFKYLGAMGALHRISFDLSLARG